MAAEDVTYDNSAIVGCPRYLSITSRIGKFLVEPPSEAETVEIYGIDTKIYKKNSPDGECIQVGADLREPPIIDPVGAVGGYFIYCASYSAAGWSPPPKYEKPSPPKSCHKNESSTPNPVFLPTGEKYLEKVDWQDHGPHPLIVKRAYISSGFPSASTWNSWTHNFEHRLHIVGRADEKPNYVRILTGGVRQAFFRKSNGAWVNTNGEDVLTEFEGGWRYFDSTSNETSTYSSGGIIKERVSKNGWKYTYTHRNDGKVQNVSNAFGKVISFDYGADPASFSVSVNGVLLVSYEGASNVLERVLYPGGTGESYTYGTPGLITAVYDLQGQILDAFNYDSQARAISTEKPLRAESYTITYNSDGSIGVTDPLGNRHSYSFLSKYGDAKLTSLDKVNPALSQGISKRTIGPDGLTQSETDFLDSVTTYQWDAGRRLPLYVTEAAGRPEERTTSTTWHPQWRLPLTVTEAGRTTTYTYDSVGNRLSQTVADTSLGSTARTSSWTYHPNGLIATETAPNGATTS
jgi:YD repeat-containing protein